MQNNLEILKTPSNYFRKGETNNLLVGETDRKGELYTMDIGGEEQRVGEEMEEKIHLIVMKD